jgi:hypothetical protein
MFCPWHYIDVDDADLRMSETGKQKDSQTLQVQDTNAEFGMKK